MNKIEKWFDNFLRNLSLEDAKMIVRYLKYRDKQIAEDFMLNNIDALYKQVAEDIMSQTNENKSNPFHKPIVETKYLS